MKNVNVAEILKSCERKIPTELFDLLIEKPVTLDAVVTQGDSTQLQYTIRDKSGNIVMFTCSEYGTLKNYPEGLQFLVPSKEMRDWNKFAWKKGDVLCAGVDNLCIFLGWGKSKDYTSFIGRYYNITPGVFNKEEKAMTTSAWKKEVNPNIISKYIASIEKCYGGELDMETLEVKKPVLNGSVPVATSGDDKEDPRWTCTLQTFDYCLARQTRESHWGLYQFAHMTPNGYMMVGGIFFGFNCEVVPYEGNEKFLGSDYPITVNSLR